MQNRGIKSTKFLDPINYAQNSGYSETVPDGSKSWVEETIEEINPLHKKGESQGILGNLKDILELLLGIGIVGGAAYIGYQIYTGSKD